MRISAMRIKAAGMLAIFASLAWTGAALAQDLGPQVKKLADGIYVHVGKGFDSNSGIILTQDGVVVIDTGQNPIESRDIMATVKKLTPMPVRLVIDTEPHDDHTTGHFVFSPPAIVVAAAGGGESMRGADRSAPDRIQRLAATSPEMKAALEGYKFITPHIEYHDRMTINLGERTFELMYLKGVHSESDNAVWLPKERVLFSASAFVVNQINILRPFVTIPDILAAGKMMKALEPGARGSRARHARHGQDFRGRREVLRAASGPGRQADEGRQIAGRHQEGGEDARICQLRQPGPDADQCRCGLQGAGRKIGQSARLRTTSAALR